MSIPQPRSDDGYRWHAVSADAPCPACKKPDWCAWTPDHEMLKCERTAVASPGMRLVRERDGGALFAWVGGGHNGRVRAAPSRASPPTDWAAEVERLRSQVTPRQVADLARELGVQAEALVALDVGWAEETALRRLRAGGAGWMDDYPTGAYSFPDRDGSGYIVGLSLRAPDGRKGAPLGAQRGLVYPVDLLSLPGTVLVVEGATDVAACRTLGLAAVGRPSNAAGTQDVAGLLEGSDVIVVGENDKKPNGSWPGREGAKRVADGLAVAWGKPVTWALPMDGAKDVRSWLQQQVVEGLELTDVDGCRAAGERLLVDLRSHAEQADVEQAAPQPKKSQADLILALARERYRFGRSSEGEAFAVEQDGPNIALPLRDALRSELARAFAQQHGKVPNKTSLSDALAVLEGDAAHEAEEDVSLRVASLEDQVVVDLGDESGRAILLDPTDWRLVDRSPVLFRRTELTNSLCVPTRPGDLTLLEQLVNVSERDWPVLVAWMVAGFLPDIPHPIALIGGQQGTGKSTAARMIANLLDRSAAPLRAPPKGLEAWASQAAASWVVVLDNISRIDATLSDALCRAVTGDSVVTRRLYTNDRLHVRSFRRVVMLTSIDAGALRGDLGERLVMFDLDPIPPEQRLTETELEARFQQAAPSILAALLDLVVHVLSTGSVPLETMGRMADFEQVLAAVDRVLGTEGLATYRAQAGRIALDVIESDPVAEAVLAFAHQVTEWTGTAGQLLKKLAPEDKPQGWPKSPKGLGCALRRATPALALEGVEVLPPVPTDKTRLWMIRLLPGDDSAETAQTAQPPDAPSSLPHRDGAGSGGLPGDPATRPGNSPPDTDDQPGPDTDAGSHLGRSGCLVGSEAEASDERRVALPLTREEVDGILEGGR